LNFSQTFLGVVSSRVAKWPLFAQLVPHPKAFCDHATLIVYVGVGASFSSWCRDSGMSPSESEQSKTFFGS
jgi:hypothetical protein